MSVFTNRGKAAKESLNQKNNKIDFKKVYIRLKDGDSVRVRILSPEDYVEYLAHGNYNLGIFTQPCLRPAGETCPLCEANEVAKTSDDEELKKKFEGLYPRKRYVFAFADIDSGEIRAWDATKGQAKGIIDTIEQYAEDLNDVAFVFKRTGNKTETTYTLNPILKLKGDDVAKFRKFDDQVVDDAWFNAVLQPRGAKHMMEALEKAGFPIELIGGVPSASDEEISEITEDDEDNLF